MGTPIHVHHNVAVRTASKLTSHKTSHHGSNISLIKDSKDLKDISYELAEEHDFERRYLKEEEKESTLKYMQSMHRVVKSVVQCIAIRWVNIQGGVGIELLDYTGKQMIIPRESVLSAINSGKLEVINIQMQGSRLILMA